jgi:predicted nucleotidyltransferase
MREEYAALRARLLDLGLGPSATLVGSWALFVAGPKSDWDVCVRSDDIAPEFELRRAKLPYCYRPAVAVPDFLNAPLNVLIAPPDLHRATITEYERARHTLQLPQLTAGWPEIQACETLRALRLLKRLLPQNDFYKTIGISSSWTMLADFGYASPAEAERRGAWRGSYLPRRARKWDRSLNGEEG